MKRVGRPKKRITNSGKRGSSAPPILESPKKRMKWSKESMVAAMKAVSKGSTIRKAALEHGVPRTTLQDRITGRVEHGCKPGAKPYLNKLEETNLANFLEIVSGIGYGKTKKQVKVMVEKTARDKDVLRKRKISDGWFRRFIERQPQLSMRRGDRTAFVRLDAMKKKEDLDNYFITLKSILVDNDLMNKPGQIFNVDESGMPLEHQAPKVVARKGQKKVRYCSSGNKSQVTVVGCINAIGQALPPFIIFNAKNLNLDWTNGEVPGTMYGLSENGWIDMVLFKEWFCRHFLHHAGSNRPLLLLLDGHSSHYNLEAITLARQNEVIIFTLVPHTTHEMQPLDTAVFGPLKNNWSEACHEYVQSHPGRVITKYQFNEIFSKAWLKSMMPGNIIGGFKVCGVYPFNPKMILDHDPCSPPKDKSQKNSDQNVIVESEGSSDNDAVDEPFTPEEEALYARLYEEGYDMYDARYVSWIQATHPEDNSEKLLNFFPDVRPLDSLPLESVLLTPTTSANAQSTFLPSTPTDVLSLQTTTSTDAVVDAAELKSCSVSVSSSASHNMTCTLSSTNVSTESAHSSRALLDMQNMLAPRSGSNLGVTPGSTPSRVLRKVYSCESTPTSSACNSTVHVALTPESTDASIAMSTAFDSDSAVDFTSTPVSAIFDSTPKRSHKSIPDAISKYLVQYVSPPPAKKTGIARVTGSRVLTSDEGYAILREKEDKKQREKEEKEKRKQEREDKRKQKSEFAKKRAEEKTKKATLQPARKTRRKRKDTATAPAIDSHLPSSSNVTEVLDIREEVRFRIDSAEGISVEHTNVSDAMPATAVPGQEDGQEYECCECFGTFEEDISLGNGAEWVQCACKQWIHMECISETVIDENGKQRVCSNCVI